MDPLVFPIRSDKLAMSAEVVAEVHRRTTPFQDIAIVETTVFGRALLLDGHIQLTEFDERAYHEALVHIPMLALDAPRRALVVGGGDGGVLRELCRHRSLEAIDMVEIDPGVVEACREHLPAVSGGAFEDARVRLHLEDAFPFVKQDREPYDLIVMDVTDVYEDEEGELSAQLFTGPFYSDVLRLLAPGGIVATQADNHVFCPYSLEAVLRDLGSVFAATGWYQALVPSFGGFSAFAWGAREQALPQPWDPARADRLGLRYLNSVTHALAFAPLNFA